MRIDDRPEGPPVQGAGQRRELRAKGKYAHIPGGSEQFAREKQLEIAREDRVRG
jgi:hypothetical protein